MTRLSIAMVLMLLIAPSLAHAQVRLEHKITEGSKVKTTSSTKTHQILNIADMDIETRNSQTIVTVTTAGQRDEQDNIRVLTRIDSIKANLVLPGGVELEFDSTKETEPQGTQFDFVLDVLSATAKTKFTMLHGKDNKVTSVDIDRTEIDKLDDTAQAMLKGQMDPKYLAEAANQELGEIPSEEISAGDTWERTLTMRLEGGQSLTFKNAYKYEGTVEQQGKSLDKITVATKAVTYAMDNPDSPLKVTGSDLKVSSSAGTILFDRKLGRVAQQKSKVQIKGDITFDANGTELPAKLDLTFDVSSVVE